MGGRETDDDGDEQSEMYTRKLSFAIPKIPAGGSYCGGFDFIKIIPIRLNSGC